MLGCMTPVLHPIKSGDQFGRLTVVDASNRKAVQCVCVCGMEKVANADALIAADTRSCGCLRREIAQKRGHCNSHLVALSVGDVFARLTVIDPSIRQRIVCVCECGAMKVATTDRLVSGHVKSCGCLKREGPAKKHGLKHHPLISTWHGMMARCNNPNATSYKDYGGRGIYVHQTWHDARKFVEYVEAELGPRPTGSTLDRVDVNRSYEPGNIRWATASEQAANRRVNTWRGEVTCPSCGHGFPVVGGPTL